MPGFFHVYVIATLVSLRVGLQTNLRWHSVSANESTPKLGDAGGILEEDVALKVPWPRIKAYFVNLDTSVERAVCMQAQLAKVERDLESLGGSFEYERVRAVTFSDCTTPEECIVERPQCFPTNTSGFVQVHGARGVDGSSDISPLQEAHLLHGVFGNWCSHLQALTNMLAEKDDFDYFMLLEDDVIMKNFYFVRDVMGLLGRFPNHWSLITVDTFNNPGESLPKEDSMEIEDLPLHSMSRTFGTYWGAHMWLLNSRPLERFVTFYQESPAVPVDWITKVRHPLHLGMWAFQPRSVFQHDRAPIKKLPECEDTVISKSTIADLDMPSMYSLLQTHNGTVIARTTVEGMLAEAEAMLKTSMDEVQTKTSLPSDDFIADTAANQAPAFLREMASVASNLSNVSKYRNLHIFGMYRSGAGFASQLFKATLSAAIAKAECGDSAQGDNASCLNDWTLSLHRTHPDRVNEQTFGGKQNNIAVVVVRHPFAAVRSAFLRAPTFGLDCGSSIGSGNLTNPCVVQDESATGTNVNVCEHGLSDNQPVCWNSVPHAWNDFADAFTSLEQKFSKVVEIRYEDLVEYPEHFVKDIADSIGVSPQKDCVMDVAIPGVSAGSYFLHTYKETVRSCQNECWEQSECLSIVYQGSSGSCWLLPRAYHEQSWLGTEFLEADGTATVVSNKVCDESRDHIELQYSINSSARERLATQDYGAEYNYDEMTDLCSVLNKTRMFLYGYHGCQDVWPGFEELIFHGHDWDDKHLRNVLRGIPNWKLMEGRISPRVQKYNLAGRIKKMRWRATHQDAQESTGNVSDDSARDDASDNVYW